MTKGIGYKTSLGYAKSSDFWQKYFLYILPVIPLLDTKYSHAKWKSTNK